MSLMKQPVIRNGSEKTYYLTYHPLISQEPDSGNSILYKSGTSALRISSPAVLGVGSTALKSEKDAASRLYLLFNKHRVYSDIPRATKEYIGTIITIECREELFNTINEFGKDNIKWFMAKSRSGHTVAYV